MGRVAMTQALPDPRAWAGRRVLLTGHTGFKGAWLARWLTRLGARVHGFALAPEGEAAALDPLRAGVTETIGDLREPDAVAAAVTQAEPSAVFHLAAQALVPRGWDNPAGTVATNVIGTMGLLDALRRTDGPKAVLVVTSDKVYRNDDTGTAFAEAAPLGGDDPYSASKAACEVLLPSYAALLAKRGAAVASARAGNVVGGGDFGAARLIPDTVRAAREGRAVILRAPGSTRPWQDVRDCLRGYILHAEALLRGDAPQALNFGPAPSAPRLTAEEVARRVAVAFDAPPPVHDAAAAIAEKRTLSLDPSRALATLGWHALHGAAEAIDDAARFYRALAAGEDAARLADAALDAHMARCNRRAA
ncbi:CDP-glucose 4,6-dehydratase [Elioraea rosea]|uniref:CDP-glucose 4,6-dehydratase n=1 Tax=Elioraea rosea TaxID=2492390 RepID=UPI001181DE42|nr:CDP-glucose 4,6-dehydratase [Elioraea rosea]